MPASGAWYTSAATIGWTAEAATIAFGVVGIILWRLNIPKRLLIYTKESASLLLESGLTYNDGDDIKVISRGRIVHDPHLVTLTIASRSRRDIRESDFEGKPLLFHLGVPIAASASLAMKNQNAPKLEPTPATPDVQAKPCQTVQLQPSLIRKGPWCRLHLLTEGSPHLQHESPIVDVVVRRETPPESKRIYVAIGIQAGCLLFAGGIIANPHPGWPEVVIAIVLMLAAIVIGGELVTGWRGRPS
jgi:hypothetical protein